MLDGDWSSDVCSSDLFIIKVLTGPMTLTGIKKGLVDDYSIKISKKDLLEILNDMNAEGKLRKMKKGKKENLWVS
jgi:hypothetical protein